MEQNPVRDAFLAYVKRRTDTRYVIPEYLMNLDVTDFLRVVRLYLADIIAELAAYCDSQQVDENCQDVVQAIFDDTLEALSSYDLAANLLGSRAQFIISVRNMLDDILTSLAELLPETQPSTSRALEVAVKQIVRLVNTIANS